MTAEDICREVVARIEKKIQTDQSILEMQKHAQDLAKRLNTVQAVQADVQRRAEQLAREEWVIELRKHMKDEPHGYVF